MAKLEKQAAKSGDLPKGVHLYEYEEGEEVERNNQELMEKAEKGDGSWRELICRNQQGALF